MKGIIFNLLEEAIVSDHGEDTWDAILTRAAVDGAYTSLGSYPDGELRQLVAAAAGTLGEPEDTVIRRLGQVSIARLFERYPGFFSPHRETREFLMTLNDVIHAEVRKLYAAPDVPVFVLEAQDGGGISITYQSSRRLCVLAEGLIEGTAAHYGQSVSIRQTLCLLRGDDRCVLECRFSPKTS